MTRLTQTTLYLISLSIAFFSIGSAFYLQYIEHQYPCNLCLAQRFAYYVMIFLTIISLVLHRYHYAKSSLWTHILAMTATLGGLVFASRQLYLQHWADKEAMGCGIDLVSMFENFAPTVALKKLFEGTTDCAAIDWTFLGLSIADYSAIIFVVLLALQITLFLWKIRSTPDVKTV